VAFLFFDIETTGFDPQRGNILSVSYGVPGEKVRSLYTPPQEGTRIYPWVQKNVWDPIRRRVKASELISEKHSIEQWIGALKARETGTTLAGWNID
jgi:hypothetical protein